VSGFKEGKEEKQELELVVMLVEMMGAVIRDYNTYIAESMKVNAIVGEAANSLRVSFKGMNNAANGEGDASVEFQDAFEKVISTLQFEDITSQIIYQLVNHQRLAKSMLYKTQDVLDELMNESNVEQKEFLTQVLREEFEAFIQNMPKFDSVRQHDMSVGETELF
jgi:hypothetical protein